MKRFVLFAMTMLMLAGTALAQGIQTGTIRGMVKDQQDRAVPGATVVSVNDESSLRPYLNDHGVLLINRVLDGGFETGSGIELIEKLAQSESKPAMILVSNLIDAQQQAAAAGARRGFGKSALYAESTAAILREAAKHEE